MYLLMIKTSTKASSIKTTKLIQIDKVDVNKILVSKTESYSNKSSFKDFVLYDDNDNIRQLCIKLPQMSRYSKYSVR